MFTQLLTATLNNLHPLINDFPAVLLTLSVVLDFAAHWRRNLHFVGWVNLLAGVIGALLALLTGWLAHLPFEGTSYMVAIQPHLLTALAATLVFLGLAVYRLLLRRRGVEAADGMLYRTLALVGLALVIVTGIYGSNLVYELGIGVRGITR